MFKKRDLSLPVPRKFNGQNQEQIQKMFGLSLHLSKKKKATLHTFNGKNCTRASKTACVAFESVIETYAQCKYKLLQVLQARTSPRW